MDDIIITAGQTIFPYVPFPQVKPKRVGDPLQPSSHSQSSQARLTSATRAPLWNTITRM
ncbi:hypothetical protein PtA15_9A382 [Puccinia triticina]|uniref:Uncharacterized protein n=1 Tax=Puccinia triticina TaxID=208348 RepID=A0ABY7CTD3_9BASI|nr:uncharacterized protein PtA15_9A382 [Puccinia triticina]WAQ88255.1 hypothetical protein PtA15_9A382 [Puccinia triticina]WAR60429.1 hypothetical protein PtB15_9B368 [Puccinia triticina]